MLGLGNSLTGGNVLGGFATPADLPDIAHWWKHDTGLEESDESAPEDGEEVTKWADQIGSEHFLGADDGSNLPIYTSATGTLNFLAGSILTIASGTSADITLDGDFAVYARIKFGQTPNVSDVFYSDTDSSNNFLRANSATVLRAKITSGSLNFTVPTMGTSAFYNIGVERVSGVVHAYLDGTESSTGGIANTESWLIDTLKGAKLDAFSSMIIVKGSNLSTSDRAALQTYLAAL